MSLDKKMTANCAYVNVDGYLDFIDIKYHRNRAPARLFMHYREVSEATLLKLWLVLKCFSSFTIWLLARIYGRGASFIE